MEFHEVDILIFFVTKMELINYGLINYHLCRNQLLISYYYYKTRNLFCQALFYFYYYLYFLKSIKDDLL